MKISKLQLDLSSSPIYAWLSLPRICILPAFKAMEIDFATGPEQIALSLTVFLVGMAFGQLDVGS